MNMSHETATENPLLSTKPSDSNLTISLHPLVLLTVSDHITRHRVRGEAGPVVGALLGQQRGRETTIEHAFQCKAITSPDGEIILDQSWFEDRLQQCK
jgi:COP9 signalosome complex subunit 6